MKIKTFETKDKTILPLSLSSIFNSDEYCIIDIETTGLSSKYNQIILIGILYNINNTVTIKQFFAENPKEEIHILKEFAHIYKNFSYVITYNGASFDLPFLQERFSHNNLEWNFTNIRHIDILQCLRKQKEKLPLENLKLKTVERFIGINRKDTISGKDSVLLYKEYVKHPSPSLEKTILLHNYEDIYYLNNLLNIFDRIHIEKYDLIVNNIVIVHNSQDINFCFFPKDISIKKNMLIIKGRTPKLKKVLDVMYYESSFTFEWFPSDGIFSIQIPLYEGHISTGEKCSYVNLENFNLSKSLFTTNTNYTEKYFPNSFMVLKIEKDISINLISDLLNHILGSIFSS